MRNVSKGMSFLQLFRYTHKHSVNINTNSALTSTHTCTHKHRRPTDTHTNANPKKNTCIQSIQTQNLHVYACKHTTKTTYAPHLEVNAPGLLHWLQGWPLVLRLCRTLGVACGGRGRARVFTKSHRDLFGQSLLHNPQSLSSKIIMPKESVERHREQGLVGCHLLLPSSGEYLVQTLSQRLTPSLQSTHHSDVHRETGVAQPCPGGETLFGNLRFPSILHFKVNNFTQCLFKKLNIMILRNTFCNM